MAKNLRIKDQRSAALPICGSTDRRSRRHTLGRHARRPAPPAPLAPPLLASRVQRRSNARVRSGAAAARRRRCPSVPRRPGLYAAL
eukprot:scaffold1469_cov257-Pinguiococcus_pyrenoidosus.AAC.10